jgi:hypothetical protein
VENNGNIIFSGGDNVGNEGPGAIVAMGEVNDTSLPMEGDFHGLQHMWSNSTWYDWSGLTPCEDSPYSVFSYGATYLKDDGNT